MPNSDPSPFSREIAALKTLPELFSWRVAATPAALAYQEYDQHNATWNGSTWQETAQRVTQCMNALAGLNLEPGARVAILLPNGLAAVCIDQAVMAMGCVPVPMHALDNPASIAYILSDSDAALLIADSDLQWQGISQAGMALPALKQVVVNRQILPGAVSASGVPVKPLEAWLSDAPDAAQHAAFPAAADLAALVYTSGTTGKPKGVMLTHANVMSNVLAVVQCVAPRSDDVFLSFLPLSHTFERTAGYYLPIAAGASVAFSRSPKQLPEDFLAVRPTILISVPRVYERVYGVMQNRLSGSAFRSALFHLAIATGWRRFCRNRNNCAGNGLQTILDALTWPILQRLVAQKLLTQFGGRLRIAVSGGAALSLTVSRCFLALGIPLVQGYGMTESSPVVAFNAPDDNDPATVGRPLSNVEVRIGENAELQVRGPNVMRGYWKREADTALAFIDGWLRTGDQAEIVSGRVRIMGRLKEIIVTSTGEKIAPVDLELAIMNDAVFEQAYVFGENAPFIGCAVVLSKSYWAELALSLNLKPDDSNSLTAPAAVNAVVKRIRELTKSFPYYAQPRSAILALEPWTVENTLITPTLKLKRTNLANFFAQGIQNMYSNAVHSAAKH